MMEFFYSKCLVYPYSTVTDCFSTNTFDPKNSNKKDVESILFSFDLIIRI